MSLESAKKLLSEANIEDYIGKSEEEIQLFLKENGYDCTLEEIGKACILEDKLSDDEMEKVSGGKYFDREHCSGDYYSEACSDTVETDSKCWSGDNHCLINGRAYHAHCADTLKEEIRINYGPGPTNFM